METKSIKKLRQRNQARTQQRQEENRASQPLPPFPQARDESVVAPPPASAWPPPPSINPSVPMVATPTIPPPPSFEITANVYERYVGRAADPLRSEATSALGLSSGAGILPAIARDAKDDSQYRAYVGLPVAQRRSMVPMISRVQATEGRVDPYRLYKPTVPPQLEVNVAAAPLPPTYADRTPPMTPVSQLPPVPPPVSLPPTMAPPPPPSQMPDVDNPYRPFNEFMERQPALQQPTGGGHYERYVAADLPQPQRQGQPMQPVPFAMRALQGNLAALLLEGGITDAFGQPLPGAFGTMPTMPAMPPFPMYPPPGFPSSFPPAAPAEPIAPSQITPPAPMPAVQPPDQSIHQPPSRYVTPPAPLNALTTEIDFASLVAKFQEQGNYRNWNEQLQTLLEQPTSTAEAARDRAEEVQSLAAEFARQAIPVVDIIVSELHLPDSRKTIKPIAVGLAGGAKYIHSGMFMKIARDERKMYGGDDTKAMKSAAHELRSVVHLMSANVPHLHFPLMALLQCRGYVVIVQSILPVTSQGTLVYGSNDAGYTIHANDDEFAELMKEALQRLNLAGHRVWNRGHSYWRMLYGPGDMEGHRGKDGRLYLIDCARLFPPFPPPEGDETGHLYRLLRPELVASNPVPLVSDTFSGWCWDPPHDSEYHLAVQACATRMQNDNVTRCALLLESYDARSYPQHALSADLHLFGINVRWLGLVRARLRNAAMRRMLFIEGVARTIRHDLFAAMRAAQTQTEDDGSPLLNHVACTRRCISGFLSSVFGWKGVKIQHVIPQPKQSANRWADLLRPNVEDKRVFPAPTTASAAAAAAIAPKSGLDGDGYWHGILQARVLDSFPELLTHVELECEDLRTLLPLVELFERVCALAGVVVSEQTKDQLRTHKHHKAFLMQDSDVLDVEVRFRHVYLPSEAFAARQNVRDLIPQYENDLRMREEALGPNHPQLVSTLIHLAELYCQKGRRLDGEKLMFRAVDIRHQVGDIAATADTLAKAALFFYTFSKYEHAELYAAECLKLRMQQHPDGCHTTVAEALFSSALILRRLGKYSEAEGLLQRAMQTQEELVGKDNPSLTHMMQQLAHLYTMTDKIDKSLPLLQRAIELNERVWGTEHSQYANALNSYAIVLQQLQEYDQAQELFKKVLQIREKCLSADHPDVASSCNNLAMLYQQRRINALEAKMLLDRAIKIREEQLGPDNTELARSLNNKGLLYKQGVVSPTEAEVLLQRALKIRQDTFPANHPETAASVNNLGQLFVHLKDYGAAEPLLKRALEMRTKTFEAGHPQITSSYRNLAQLFRSTERYQEADRFERKMKAHRRKHRDSVSQASPSPAKSASFSFKADEFPALGIAPKPGHALTSPQTPVKPQPQFPSVSTWRRLDSSPETSSASLLSEEPHRSAVYTAPTVIQTPQPSSRRRTPRSSMSSSNTTSTFQPTPPTTQ
eukprot:TRINITY_DN3351_c0_g2_i1.p1 TRINITY_DN3351_c0_g2~~TRINITY_DN3351_c0_g2_i1.p1  ORF type:complete len:1439 (+),score=307.78 TRINITY_DN3351_c0_g2_i1:55-4371(+)